MTVSQLHHDVTIVGAGPVGLMLGCWLRKLGLSVIVVEKRATRSTQSKASSMNAYSLAILHALGIHDRFARAGKPVQNLMLYWNARRLMRVNYQHVPSRYKHILCLSQPETEELLEACFLEWGGVLQRSTEVLAFRQDGEGVDVDVRAAGGAETATLRSRYLVGCDGGRSMVRQGLGVAFPGIDHGTGFIMFDARIRWDGDLDTVHYFVRDDGFLIVIPQAAGTHRIIIRTPDNERTDVGADRLAGYRRLTAQYGPAGLVVEDVFWESETRYYNRLADRYGEGRVFLAGDACHLFSSIGGLGMNTGFQDALALAWRLAGVVQGRLRDDVLASYGVERRAITQQLIASTDANTRLITRDDTDPDGAVRGWLPVMANRRRMADVLPLNFSGLGQAYAEGLLGGGSPALVGRLVPYVELDGGARPGCSYDLVDGRHFLFLHAGEPGAVLRAVLERAGPVRLLRLADGPGGRAALDRLQLHAGHGLLVRPDGIVALHVSMQSVDAYAAYLQAVAARPTQDIHRISTASQHETLTHL